MPNIVLKLRAIHEMNFGRRDNIISLRASSPFRRYREKWTRERRRESGGRGPLVASLLARVFSRGSLRYNIINYEKCAGGKGRLGIV